MRLNRMASGLLAVGLLVFCTSCLDLAVSFNPWFETDDSGSANSVFDARLLGWWCTEDGSCAGDESLYWAAGPEDSYNVFEDDRLAYRVWLGEIGGKRFLNFRFMCEPALGTEEDHCHGAVGSHFVARVARLEHRVVELRLLDTKRLEELLEAEEDPLAYGKPDETIVLAETTERLSDFLRRIADDEDMWDEESVTLTRAK